MYRVILVRGIQASGKSTWAKQWVLEKPTNRVRINMDDIRNMLGKYWVPERESLVKEIQLQIFISCLNNLKEIVIDNTNMNPKAIKTLVETAKDAGYTVEYKDFFDTPLSICIERDRKRENPVGEEVIRNFYNKYKDLYPLNGN
jgi:predicted kinase